VKGGAASQGRNLLFRLQSRGRRSTPGRPGKKIGEDVERARKGRSARTKDYLTRKSICPRESRYLRRKNALRATQGCSGGSTTLQSHPGRRGESSKNGRRLRSAGPLGRKRRKEVPESGVGTPASQRSRDEPGTKVFSGERERKNEEKSGRSSSHQQVLSKSLIWSQMALRRERERASSQIPVPQGTWGKEKSRRGHRPFLV